MAQTRSRFSPFSTAPRRWIVSYQERSKVSIGKKTPKTNQLKTTTTASSTDFSTLWIVEANGDGFAFRNAATSRYAAPVDGDKPLTTSLDNRKLWLDFKHSSENYYNISGNNTFADGSCFVFANNTLKGGNARNKTTQKNEKKRGCHRILSQHPLPTGN